ncbi:glycosyltransferase family 2 protein [Rhizobium etli 8C-3]|uniref:GT2 family glycosyltransferase n=2 Tax=Rhizobium TaxID=379 RepID=A0A4R3REZ5_9HYPH|nr:MULTISPECIES: glycosyltransferase family 2 protein [Rhizobium]APO76453.1 glycosyltransferase family 2 protein [Rhizobium etli 8C-3]TCU17861.1 GT2 family glycosyltransferase [Rhizobium azibense]TCU31962.1 GT2 family glycosyltransferase [Rhizobium azibense]
MTFDESIDATGVFRNAKIFRLGAELAVLIWDLPPSLPATTKCLLSMDQSPIPLVSMMLPLGNGRQRMFWAMRPEKQPVSVGICTEHGSTAETIVMHPARTLVPLDVETLFADLAPDARIKFVNNLLTVWRSAFRIASDHLFNMVVEDALHALVPQPQAASIVCQIARGSHLIETAINPDLGDITAIYAIGAASITRMAVRLVRGRNAKNGMQSCHFIAEVPSPPFLIVLLSKNGVAIRQLADGKPRHPSLQSWWGKNLEAVELREMIVRRLATLPESGAATAIDLQVCAPLASSRIAKSSMHPSGEVDLALALDDGLLAGGWFHAPSSAFAGIDYVKEDGTAVPLDANSYEFPAWAQGKDEKSKTDVTGFVAWVPLPESPGPLLQPRFQMRLASGAVRPLIPTPQPFEPATQRNHVLRAVPPQHAVDGAFRTILAPALQDIERRLGKTIEVDSTKDYSLPKSPPLVSIVVPLYRVLDFLRFQLSGMATDPWLAANAEVIYVLDSPEIQDQTEHLLGGLHLLHGLPMKLVVMNRNGGYARACNAGARFARGAILVMLNSDVVPCAPGWLQVLSRALLKSNELGAVGPKLIYEDGSLQHAGLYFGRDQRGIWLNHHFHKGMPGDYVPAQQARDVPGVTGACLVTRRDTYERVGGYTEDYVIGDYEDSDLCLKIRRVGLQIAYEPAACLYHFERRSIRRSQDYMRGVASQYNSWLHTQRWEEDIAELMANLFDRDHDRPAAAGMRIRKRNAA